MPEGTACRQCPGLRTGQLKPNLAVVCSRGCNHQNDATAGMPRWRTCRNPSVLHRPFCRRCQSGVPRPPRLRSRRQSAPPIPARLALARTTPLPAPCWASEHIAASRLKLSALRHIAREWFQSRRFRAFRDRGPAGPVPGRTSARFVLDLRAGFRACSEHKRRPPETRVKLAAPSRGALQPAAGRRALSGTRGRRERAGSGSGRQPFLARRGRVVAD